MNDIWTTMYSKVLYLTNYRIQCKENNQRLLWYLIGFWGLAESNLLCSMINNCFTTCITDGRRCNHTLENASLSNYVTWSACIIALMKISQPVLREEKVTLSFSSSLALFLHRIKTFWVQIRELSFFIKPPPFLNPWWILRFKENSAYPHYLFPLKRTLKNTGQVFDSIHLG